MSQTASADGQPTGLVGNTEAELGGVGETIKRQPPFSELPVLPAISLGEAGAAHAPDLVTLSELGRGGMGVVRLAEQRSLGREVAIKTSHSKDPSTARALVREARIMGALEHPNLVPVHSLGTDQEGTPVLVMKRVEGSSWRELLRNPRTRAGARCWRGIQTRSAPTSRSSCRSAARWRSRTTAASFTATSSRTT